MESTDKHHSATIQTSRGLDETTITPRLRLDRLQLLGSDHRPYFTCVLTLAHVFMVTWMCWNTGFSTIGLSPIVHKEIEPHTFQGNVVVSYNELPNPFIGPTKVQLVSYGALLPPCVREDHALNVLLAQNTYPSLNIDGKGLGCCEAPWSNVAATTTKEECSALSDGLARWRENQCSMRSSREASVQHILRPCCGELNGKCTLTSPQHCWFLKGHFHLSLEHCTQVDCLRQLCTLGNNLRVDESVTEFSPRQSNDWWRLLTSLYIPQGILDSLLMICLQLWLSWGQENSLGWLRMALVYHTAGVGGQSIGSLFTMYDSLQAGAGPAVGGLLGLSLVEHVIVWPALKNPRGKLVMLIASGFLLLAFGTLPQLNNFSLIFGLLYGCLFSLVFLSHLVFTTKPFIVKFILICFLGASFFLGLVAFYGVQQVHINSVFDYINCVPYARGLCG